MTHRLVVALIVGASLLLAAAAVGEAAPRQRGTAPSDLDPTIMQIDEKKYLGVQLDPDVSLVDERGQEFRMADMFGRPFVVLLSYYTCDGSCSIINGQFKDVLPGVTGLTVGDDFRVVTLSFDRHDNLETTGAFRKHLALTGEYDRFWKFATFKNEADLAAQTEKIGFKFFWSPRDRMFLHPGAFLFFSSKGRLVRVLYPPVESRDVELALLDARQGKFEPREIIKYAISLCYSYSYADGKYILSIPIFVGIGALAFGIATLAGSVGIYKWRRKRGALP